MTLDLANLDETTRPFMIQEMEDDLRQGRLYMSDRLSAIGRKEYVALLREAIERGTDATLAAALGAGGRLNTHEVTAKGRRKLPVTAPQTLAEGEFNRFYMRGLCRRAIDEGASHVVVDRVKEVKAPRPESVAKMGMHLDPRALLADLRASIGVDTALGLPAGPNSGLSVRLPDVDETSRT